MSSVGRTLSREFLHVMCKYDAWPALSTIELWLRNVGEVPIRTGVLGKMLKGMPGQPRHIVGLAAYLQATVRKHPLNRTSRAFCEFMALRTGDDIRSMSPATIAEYLIATEPDPFFSGLSGILDSFRARISDRVTGKKFITVNLQGCREYDIKSLIDWFYVWVAGEFDLRKLYLSTDLAKAIQVTEEAIALQRDEFEQLAKRWWAHEPWTVVLARGKYSPTGLSIVLPLRQDAYEAMRNGQLGLRELTPADLSRPSRHLLTVAIAQRPVLLGGDDGDTFKNIMAAHISQVAILSACERETEHHLRVLALVGTPQNAVRAKQFGYEPLHTVTPDQRLPIYERVYGERLSIEDMILLGFTAFLGRNARYFPRPPYPGDERTEQN